MVPYCPGTCWLCFYPVPLGICFFLQLVGWSWWGKQWSRHGYQGILLCLLWLRQIQLECPMYPNRMGFFGRVLSWLVLRLPQVPTGARILLGSCKSPLVWEASPDLDNGRGRILCLGAQGWEDPELKSNFWSFLQKKIEIL